MKHSLGSLLPFSGKPWASVILEEEGDSWSFAADRGVPGLGTGDRYQRRAECLLQEVVGREGSWGGSGSPV